MCVAWHCRYEFRCMYIYKYIEWYKYYRCPCIDLVWCTNKNVPRRKHRHEPSHKSHFHITHKKKQRIPALFISIGDSCLVCLMQTSIYICWEIFFRLLLVFHLSLCSVVAFSSPAFGWPHFKSSVCVVNQLGASLLRADNVRHLARWLIHMCARFRIYASRMCTIHRLLSTTFKNLAMHIGVRRYVANIKNILHSSSVQRRLSQNESNAILLL